MGDERREGRGMRGGGESVSNDRVLIVVRRQPFFQAPQCEEI
jgi:hypothetical protein